MVITEKVREAFGQLLENNIDQLEGWLHALAKKNPEKALDLWVRISERFLPSLQRTDVHLESSGIMIPIQINLPNPPQINIGEGASTRSLDSPAKELGEGSLAEIPMFLQEPLPRGEGTPAEDPGEAWGELKENPFNKL